MAAHATRRHRKATPRPVVDRLNKEVVRVLALPGDPEHAHGSDDNARYQFERRVQRLVRAVEKWACVVKAAHIKLE
jgi:hypothetical protein